MAKIFAPKQSLKDLKNPSLFVTKVEINLIFVKYGQLFDKRTLALTDDTAINFASSTTTLALAFMIFCTCFFESNRLILNNSTKKHRNSSQPQSRDERKK
ncbi:hypothetical protein BpHYR1_027535 [Brachionus plicatilis]|uniref:Uncharacterized protein n=1 Tax=Brachionus plicatilis TaxID=10195 RepID=A0A3M7SNH6_BRAPC|nr:hypothetical protein BpHYR1_027535 [Brachionus plicatilis]